MFVLIVEYGWQNIGPLNRLDKKSAHVQQKQSIERQ